jgi:hypothetical protein
LSRAESRARQSRRRSPTGISHHVRAWWPGPGPSGGRRSGPWRRSAGAQCREGLGAGGESGSNLDQAGTRRDEERQGEHISARARPTKPGASGQRCSVSEVSEPSRRCGLATASPLEVEGAGNGDETSPREARPGRLEHREVHGARRAGTTRRLEGCESFTRRSAVGGCA